MTPEVTSVACSNPSSNWTNLVYRLNTGPHGVVVPSADQEKISQCWENRLLSLYRESLIPAPVLSAVIQGLPTCPCTRQQALDDKQFAMDPLNNECFLSRFIGQLSLGKSCCYRTESRLVFEQIIVCTCMYMVPFIIHSSLPNGLPYVSFFLPHIRLSSVDAIREIKFRDSCCEDLSLGVCDLYYSRRSLNPFSSCFRIDNYTPRSKGK